MGEEDRGCSRREFLKIAGVAGAAVGVGGGLGGLLAACGSQETTTTTAGATTTTAGVTTTTAGATTTTGGATTTVSTEAEVGREIKIGWLSPQTGKLAIFGLTDKYQQAKFLEIAKDGYVLGDGKRHFFTIDLRDSQSDVNRSSQVTADMILNAKVDIVTGAVGGDTAVPMSDQAEALETPAVTIMTPWQAWFFGRKGDPKVGFKWTYHHSFGQEDLFKSVFDMWPQLPTNKVVGVLWPNDIDGKAYRDAWPAQLDSAGYKWVDAGMFEDTLEDYTTIIEKFKSAGCEIMQGVMNPPGFTNLYKQCQQQAYRPKIVTVLKAYLFPAALKALGPSAENLSTTLWWTPLFPYKSSLTGQTCREWADEFEAAAQTQWTPTICYHAVCEWIVDAFKRTKNVDDKEQVIAAVGSTKLETVAGVIDFQQEVGTAGTRPVKNVSRSPCGAGQWVKSTKWPYDLTICASNFPDAIKPNATLQPLPKL